MFTKELAMYLLGINTIGLVLMYIDKTKAIKGNSRIPEKTLFSTAFVGGSIGVLIGMYLFRHKTKKLSFTMGVPMIIVIQIILIYGFEFLW